MELLSYTDIRRIFDMSIAKKTVNIIINPHTKVEDYDMVLMEEMKNIYIIVNFKRNWMLKQ